MSDDHECDDRWQDGYECGRDSQLRECIETLEALRNRYGGQRYIGQSEIDRSIAALKALDE